MSVATLALPRPMSIGQLIREERDRLLETAAVLPSEELWDVVKANHPRAVSLWRDELANQQGIERCQRDLKATASAARWDQEWAWYAWQAVADDAKRWPSVQRVGGARAAWEHYWAVTNASDDLLERAA